MEAFENINFLNYGVLGGFVSLGVWFFLKRWWPKYTRDQERAYEDLKQERAQNTRIFEGMAAAMQQNAQHAERISQGLQGLNDNIEQHRSEVRELIRPPARKRKRIT